MAAAAVAPPKYQHLRMEMRCVLLGAGGVGKSSLVSRFTQNHCPEKYIPTIEDSYRKLIQVDGHPVNLNVDDTAGQDFASVQLSGDYDYSDLPKHVTPEDLVSYDPLVKSYLRNAHFYILVFDVSKHKSFELCDRLIRLLKLVLHDKIPAVSWDRKLFPAVLVANKCDMGKLDHEVSGTEMDAFCNRHGVAHWLYCSAKTSHGVADAFESSIRLRWACDKFMEDYVLVRNQLLLKSPTMTTTKEQQDKKSKKRSGSLKNRIFGGDGGGSGIKRSVSVPDVAIIDGKPVDWRDVITHSESSPPTRHARSKSVSARSDETLSIDRSSETYSSVPSSTAMSSASSSVTNSPKQKSRGDWGADRQAIYLEVPALDSHKRSSGKKKDGCVLV